MNNHINIDSEDLDELADSQLFLHAKKSSEDRRKGKTLLRQKGNQQIVKSVNSFIEADYPFSYHASLHDKQWLMESISEFYEQNWFEDILSVVKGGKEASVYLCKAPARMEQVLLAAKVYRPRRFRNLKKDHLYREGRSNLDATGKVIVDDRTDHAMAKKTGFGLAMMHASWVGHEYHTMEILYAAGADIPKPYASSNNAIMMDYIGDELGAAPTLNSVNLTSTEARELFQRVTYNIELMLNCNRVHADLSAYNILYWDGGITLIDFPQAINPEENHNAWRIFARDVQRVCDYFTSQGVQCNANELALKMWKSKGRATQPEIDPHYLDPEKEEDYHAWKKQK